MMPSKEVDIGFTIANFSAKSNGLYVRERLTQPVIDTITALDSGGHVSLEVQREAYATLKKNFPRDNFRESDEMREKSCNATCLEEISSIRILNFKIDLPKSISHIPPESRFETLKFEFSAIDLV